MSFSRSQLLLLACCSICMSFVHGVFECAYVAKSNQEWQGVSELEVLTLLGRGHLWLPCTPDLRVCVPA